MHNLITPQQLASFGSETGEQQALFCWSALPEIRQAYPDLKWLFAVPNGGFRHKVVASRLRAEGVKRGVPDIWLPVKRDKWSGLIIELKKISKKKDYKIKPTPEQNEWLNYLATQDFGTMVCHGWEHARDALIQYLTIGKNVAQIKMPERKWPNHVS